MAQYERTLLVVKPDGVERSLVGEIIYRIERVRLKVVALKRMKPDCEFIEKFLSGDKKWLTGMGNKALFSFAEAKSDPVKTFGTRDPFEIGKMVKEWLIEFWLSGPVVAMIISGPNAIARVREIVGDTIPRNAREGTIRRDYATFEDPVAANSEHRCMHNIVHASGNQEEAKREIEHWFSPDEIHA